MRAHAVGLRLLRHVHDVDARRLAGTCILRLGRARRGVFAAVSARTHSRWWRDRARRHPRQHAQSRLRVQHLALCDARRLVVLCTRPDRVGRGRVERAVKRRRGRSLRSVPHWPQTCAVNRVRRRREYRSLLSHGCAHASGHGGSCARARHVRTRPACQRHRVDDSDKRCLWIDAVLTRVGQLGESRRARAQ